MNGLYRIAKYCAVIPMIVGISIFVLWLLTRWDEWMMLGAFTLIGGLALLIVGFLALGAYYWIASRSPGIPRQQIKPTMFKVIGLLFSNFLVAGGIIAAVLFLGCRYTVVIHNTTQQSLDDVRVFGAGANFTFESIPPGATAQQSICIKQDGLLMLETVINSTKHTNNISGYVTKLGGYRHRSVIVGSEGVISVTPDVKLPGR